MNELSPWTQLAALLTAKWSVNGAKPLTLSEFGEFRQWVGPSSDAAKSILERTHSLETAPVEIVRLQALLSRAMGVFQAIDRWQQAGLWLRSWADPGYPERFKQLKGRAPALLFGYGDPNAFTERAIAIVGSRRASADRLSKAAEIGRACAAHEVTVVSGGAKGVDSAAMDAGMVGNGTVVGILAEQLLRASGKREYRMAIQDHRLCLMSEVNPEAPFDVGNAMARNRLAYACADAALIVECDSGSGGTWAGATEALKVGKAVYVLRGAKAERQLIERGAISIDMDFALSPARILRQERPEAALPVRSATEVLFAGVLAEAGGNEASLQRWLSENAIALATRILDALASDGLLESQEPELSSKPEESPKPKRKRTNKERVAETPALFPEVEAEAQSRQTG